MNKNEIKKAIVDRFGMDTGLNKEYLEMSLTFNEIMESFNSCLNDVIKSRTGFSINGFKLMRMLYAVPNEGLAPSIIADNIGITRASMTKIMDKLEQRGVIERMENPDDKRSSLICLTSAGKKEFSDIFSDYHIAISKQVHKMGMDKVQNSINVLTFMTRNLKEISREI